MRSGLIRVRLIGDMENCEVRKWGDDEEILVSLIFVWMELWKSEGMRNFFIWLKRKIRG